MEYFYFAVVPAQAGIQGLPIGKGESSKEEG